MVALLPGGPPPPPGRRSTVKEWMRQAAQEHTVSTRTVRPPTAGARRQRGALWLRSGCWCSPRGRHAWLVPPPRQKVDRRETTPPPRRPRLIHHSTFSVKGLKHVLVRPEASLSAYDGRALYSPHSSTFSLVMLDCHKPLSERSPLTVGEAAHLLKTHCKCSGCGAQLVRQKSSNHLRTQVERVSSNERRS